eukprot:746116-Hanusia_phi.AAC.5
MMCRAGATDAAGPGGAAPAEAPKSEAPSDQVYEGTELVTNSKSDSEGPLVPAYPARPRLAAAE